VRTLVVRFTAAIVLTAGVALVAAGCSSGSSTASRYCDVVKQMEASADPLADQAIFSDPTRLRDALAARVDTFTSLAANAPPEVRTDASTLRDDLIKINNALSKAQFQSAAANSDPVVQGVLADPAFTDALTRVEDYNANHCGE
jgi:hypothetical protein